jgi:nucleotide-binding universal stress UspA family protein
MRQGFAWTTLSATKEAAVDDAPILICYDGSPGARRAITGAAHLLPGLRAVVLDVGQVLTVAESYAAFGPAVPDFEEYNAEQARAQAEAGAEYARRAGFTAEARADVAAPTWAGVVDVANEIDAAVIVVGSRGLRGIKERLEGSVSYQIAEHAAALRPAEPVPRGKHAIDRRVHGRRCAGGARG